MATLQDRNGSFRILFLHAGTRHTFTLGKVPRPVAEGKAAKVEEVLSLLHSGYLTLPPGADVLDFVRNDGKPPPAPPEPQKAALTLKKLRDEYLRVHEGSLEKTTTVGMRRHFGHFLATFGEAFPVPALTLADLQRHADRRAKMKWRGKKIAPATVRKELVTLRTAWNWGVHMGLLAGRFPALKRVKTQKPDEKPPFMTWAEIERRLPGLSPEKQAELWDALYLRQEEVAELLAHLKANATLPWVYPLACTAAYTGARKSELIRIEAHDVDLAGGTLQVRERKRRHDRTTTRRVSITPALEAVLRDWLATHPGSVHLFYQAGEVPRSKKRGRTTGHQGVRTRATTVKGRQAGVTRRAAQETAPLTVDEHALGQISDEGGVLQLQLGVHIHGVLRVGVPREEQGDPVMPPPGLPGEPRLHKSLLEQVPHAEGSRLHDLDAVSAEHLLGLGDLAVVGEVRGFRNVQHVNRLGFRGGDDVFAADFRENQLVHVVALGLGPQALGDVVPRELHVVVEHAPRPVAGVGERVRHPAGVVRGHVEAQQVAVRRRAALAVLQDDDVELLLREERRVHQVVQQSLLGAGADRHDAVFGADLVDSVPPPPFVIQQLHRSRRIPGL